MPGFRFRIVRSFGDCLSRQVAESVRIHLREEVLHSKTVYIRNRLPRLELEKTEWDREDEERKAKLQKWKESHRKERSNRDLVRGNGEDPRKRKRLKKLRWTDEARRLASLKGIVASRWRRQAEEWKVRERWRELRWQEERPEIIRQE